MSEMDPEVEDVEETVEAENTVNDTESNVSTFALAQN